MSINRALNEGYTGRNYSLEQSRLLRLRKFLERKLALGTPNPPFLEVQ